MALESLRGYRTACDEGDGYYTKKAALLLSWEDTDLVYAPKEIERLQSVLEDGYGFVVEQWQIPCHHADLRTQDKVREFLDRNGFPENLVVVYYAGHGRPSDDPNGPPVWYARASGDDNEEELNTAAIQALLTRAREDSPDVLLLHDCCHPLSSYHSNQRTTRAVVECIFAGGFEAKVPAPGPDSFTHMLTDELCVGESHRKPLSTFELYRRLVCRLRNWQPKALFDENNQLLRDENGRPMLTINDRVTPCHLFLSRRERSILLVPRSALSCEQPVRGKTQKNDWPEASPAIRLEDDANNASEATPRPSSTPRNMVEPLGIRPTFSSQNTSHLVAADYRWPSDHIWGNLQIEDGHTEQPVGFPTGTSEVTSKHETLLPQAEADEEYYELSDGRPDQINPETDFATGDYTTQEGDPSMMIHRSSDFTPGEVIKTMWSEPRRGHSSSEYTQSESSEIIRFGEPILVDHRIFVILATGIGHSTCLNISTYDGRGCAKQGIKTFLHGIAYDGLKTPRLKKNEPKMGFDPVAIRFVEGETLGSSARINYAKTYTVEHNAKVRFLGSVNPSDFRMVQKAYNKCWERMSHEPGGGSASRRRRKA